MQFSNKENIPLPLAVWLAHDEYDFVSGKNKISATSLIKPTRQFILAGRVPIQEREYDVADFIASRFGNALHDSIERSWVTGYDSALRKLGYPQNVIEAVRINVEPDQLEPNTIPVYIERRREKDINDFTVSGKFDMAIEGELYDTKSTSVYSVILGSKEGDWIKQGSIYRWLHDDVLTGDHIHIQNIFTDWSRAQARQNPEKYPQSRLMNNTYELMSYADTESMIHDKISEIKKYWKAPDEEIPECTDEQLWRTNPKFKYYSDPNKTDGRSTKNFDNLADAHKFKAEKGKGIVITELGKVKACSYCPAFNICKQKDRYDHE